MEGVPKGDSARACREWRPTLPAGLTDPIVQQTTPIAQWNRKRRRPLGELRIGGWSRPDQQSRAGIWTQVGSRQVEPAAHSFSGLTM
jgi:hypothetical protein